MHRYKISIEYKGTNYVGWQRQDNGLSIQESLENAIKQLTAEKADVFGAGRTDAGVHALNQVAHFDLKKSMELDSIRDGLNQYLRPQPIAIIKANEVSDNFHARFSAKQRIYKYIIFNRVSVPSIYKNRGWHIRKKLDLKLMKKGTQKLLGTNDYSTFRASSCNAKNPVRTIKSIRIKKIKDRIEIQFKSQSFLQQQVRSMVGCLKYLAENKWNLKKFEKAFKSKKRTLCATPAPAHGLFLEKVIY